jgi:hypothetical protein
MGWTFYNNGGEKIASADTLDGFTSDDFVMIAGDTMTGALIISAVSAGSSQLQITDTTIGAGLTIGGDTNLFRSAADTLKTNDTFRSALDIYARDGAAGQVTLGNMGPSSQAGIMFGSGNDTRLWRQGADLLKTDDTFNVNDKFSMDATTGVLTLTDTEGTLLLDGGNAITNTRTASRSHSYRQRPHLGAG